MCVYLTKMTSQLMHAFFKEFNNDPIVSTEKYHYNPDQVDSYFEKHLQQGKLHFAIMVDNIVIGDIYLKHINTDNRSCEMGIHLVNDFYKNKGFGTGAIRQMLEYTFNTLEMESVCAETKIENERSYRALIKAGFELIEQNDNLLRFVCNRDTH